MATLMLASLVVNALASNLAAVFSSVELANATVVNSAKAQARVLNVVFMAVWFVRNAAPFWLIKNLAVV